MDPVMRGSAIDCGHRKRNSRARSARAGFGLPDRKVRADDDFRDE